MDSYKKSILEEIKNWFIFIFKVLIFIIVFISLLKYLVEYSGFFSWENEGPEYIKRGFETFGIVVLIRTIILIVSIIAINDAKKENLSKIDFTKYKDYYKDILQINSPLVLNYIDKFELDKNTIIAELLSLNKRGYIEIKNGQLEKIAQSITLQSECEKYILENIKDGKLKLKDNGAYAFLNTKIEYDAIERFSFLEQRKNKKGIIILIISIILYLIARIVSSESLIMIMFFASIACFFYAVSYLIHRKKYNRTKKGEELNEKLEGLKKYLKDYSLLDEREAKEIEIWDDYLIYSVMFGQNKKIIEEYEKYIEIIE